MTRPAPNWHALRGTLAGEVLLPGSSEYESARKPALARFYDVTPQAIVPCEVPEVSPNPSCLPGGLGSVRRPGAEGTASPERWADSVPRSVAANVLDPRS
jgi:hypothetical protein